MLRLSSHSVKLALALALVALPLADSPVQFGSLLYCGFEFLEIGAESVRSFGSIGRRKSIN